jgi:hypothetical protein
VSLNEWFPLARETFELVPKATLFQTALFLTGRVILVMGGIGPVSPPSAPQSCEHDTDPRQADPSSCLVALSDENRGKMIVDVP